ncbi:MAG: hypothetical protein ABGZ17_14795, partial [Planctomycetaceae bacterium]
MTPCPAGEPTFLFARLCTSACLSLTLDGSDDIRAASACMLPDDLSGQIAILGRRIRHLLEAEFWINRRRYVSGFP